MLLNCCGNPTEPSKIERILPLNKGNIWIYQKYFIDSKDSLLDYGIDTDRKSVV